MIEPDWNVFKAKFSSNPQEAFEWFCYLLFCEEFNKPKGIFRYKNQSGIETNPIIKGNEVVGWQAKFYDTKLTENKNGLIDTITKSHRDYPGLTKLILYTNQDWGQGRKQNEPQTKIDIDNKALELSIIIEWRTASFFESPFVTVQHCFISRHFFSLGNDIINLLEEKKKHTEQLLAQIHNLIQFRDIDIRLDRSSMLQEIENDIDKKQVLILHGPGGIGKTALIRDIYEKEKNNIPIYLLKAREFNINNINLLFQNSDMSGFIEAHKDEERKIIVIDSAEGLLEIGLDTIKEFLTVFIENNWSFILTTRDYYLEDLNYLFIDDYDIIPRTKIITGLGQEELEELANKYSFILPSDMKLRELITTPFYLNEFLKYYSEKEVLDYSGFKKKLWNQIIKRVDPNREQCFIEISINKAMNGNFFIKPDPKNTLLNEFAKEGVLGNESAGYFITHDIYEEWALEKFIDCEFNHKKSNEEFFQNIGDSLAIRRCFRKWLSDQLLLSNSTIKSFIEEVMQADKIKPIWKDEALISVLLSDSADYFFDIFSSELLKDELRFLRRLIILLRLACKEIDIDFLKQLGIENTDILRIKYVFTKPKGQGWESLIKFYYDNIDKIGHEKSCIILPLLYDWNSKFKTGETTKLASLLALDYYKYLIKNDDYYLSEDSSKKIFQTILYGASEIKQELSEVFEEVIKNNWTNHREPYNHLVEHILTEPMDSMEVIKNLPEYIIKLADLYWTWIPQNERFPYYSSIGVEHYFGLNDNHLDYYPSSAYQTPIYWLLYASYNSTIDFIINLTNKAVESYTKSELAENEVHEINIVIGEKTTKQYISDRLWKIYRGTHVAPHVLESMHMALEKFILERAPQTKSEVLEMRLLNILLRSKSASLTAIVTSIVSAYPEKTFNIAQILIQTKEFFFYDTYRLVQDKSAEMLYGMGYGNVRHKIHQDERLATCKEKHRDFRLENIVLQYQFFRSNDISEEEAEKRQRIIWDILDNYYSLLPDPTSQTDNDKTWRLYLARMDRRRMNPQIEKKDGNLLVDFNPQLDDDLKKYSDESLNSKPNFLKHSPLNLWASYKMQKNPDSEKYQQYNDPSVVLDELKEILNELHNTKERLFISQLVGILGNACSVLVKESYEHLSSEDRAFCKDIILELADNSFSKNYQYQINDGIESSIRVLPILFKHFPEQRSEIKRIILLTLFNPGSIGAYCDIFDYGNNALSELWSINFGDAQSILFGYIKLKPKYEEIRKQMYIKGVEHTESQIIDKVEDKYKDIFNKVNNNQLNTDVIKNLNQLDLSILKNVLKLIPLGSTDSIHKQLVYDIVAIFAPQILSLDRDREIEYDDKHDFISKLAQLVLSSKDTDINYYLSPILDNFNNTEAMADFFKAIIIEEDKMDTYNTFWSIWNLFYDKIIEISKKEKFSYTSEIIRSYLFAESLWREDATGWHTLKDREKAFFKKVSENIGYITCVFYSLLRLLNGIGSAYLFDGVKWISRILVKHKELWTSKLEDYTVDYLEYIIKKYIRQNRDDIRKNRQLKDEALVILNFLVEKESVVGYMLRENIL